MRINNISRYALDKARYFLEMMESSFQNDEVFSYNFDAFIVFARSVTLYLQKQYSHKEGFEKWYSPKRELMFRDADMKFFKKARNQNLKEGPILSLAIKEKEGLTYIGCGCNSVGFPEPVQYQDNEEGVEIIGRILPELNSQEILESSKDHLSKLISIVDECEKQFGNE